MERDHFSVSSVRLFTNQLSMTTFDCGGFQIEISSRERAVLEMIELLGRFHTFDESMLVFEKLGSLRPPVVQAFLKPVRPSKPKGLFDDEKLEFQRAGGRLKLRLTLC